MYLLGVLCMFGLTVALPVLPEPPKLPYSIAAAHQNREFHMNTPRVKTASSLVRNNKLHTVSIPPPPELPALDYSKFTKLKSQKARYDDSVRSEVERFVEVKDLKTTEKPVEVVKKVFKPIEYYKFQEAVKPTEESQFAKEAIPIEVEESKSAETFVPKKELTYVDEPKSVEEPVPIKEHTYVEEPKSVEEHVPIKELTYVEEPKPVEERIPIKELTYVEEPKSAEEHVPIKELTYVEEPKSAEEPVPIKEITYVEEPKPAEERVPIMESTYVQKPIFIEGPKPAENLDSSKVETEEKPAKQVEDIPVVIQFTIPTRTFLSGIFSKLLSSFGIRWPLNLTSIFSRPRQINPNYNIDDEICPY